MNKQLKEKDGNAFKDVFPINIIQNIKDGDTGKTLQNILKSFNSIFVEYKNSVEDTRNSIDESIRRKGLWVTYLPTGEQDYVTEVYIGNEESILNSWTDNSNWRKILNVDYNSTVEGKIPNGIITMEKLSPALQELLKQNNSIINYPDDEDLQADYGYLQFKNRKYNPDLASGKGYKILRKNWLGVNNVLTQDMINDVNTIYEIRYDFDLNGGEITIPEGCVLQFEGGSLSNGVINFNNTLINVDYNNIFNNISCKGKIINNKIIVEWWGDITITTQINNIINITNGATILLTKPKYNLLVPEYILLKDNIVIDSSCHSIIDTGEELYFSIFETKSYNNITIRNITITQEKVKEVPLLGIDQSQAMFCIAMGGGDNLLIENCEFTFCGLEAIIVNSANGSKNTIIRNNICNFFRVKSNNINYDTSIIYVRSISFIVENNKCSSYNYEDKNKYSHGGIECHGCGICNNNIIIRCGSSIYIVNDIKTTSDNLNDKYNLWHGVTITNNKIIDCATAFNIWSEDGSIYSDNRKYPKLTNINITSNYIKDVKTGISFTQKQDVGIVNISNNYFESYTYNEITDVDILNSNTVLYLPILYGIEQINFINNKIIGFTSALSNTQINEKEINVTISNNIFYDFQKSKINITNITLGNLVAKTSFIGGPKSNINCIVTNNIINHYKNSNTWNLWIHNNVNITLDNNNIVDGINQNKLVEPIKTNINNSLKFNSLFFDFNTGILYKTGTTGNNKDSFTISGLCVLKYNNGLYYFELEDTKNLSIGDYLTVYPKYNTDNKTIISINTIFNNKIIFDYTSYFNQFKEDTEFILEYKKYIRTSYQSGKTSNRPRLSNEDNFIYFDTDINKLLFFVNNKYVDCFGNLPNIIVKGTTQQRPTDVKAGFYYFDTTLNKPIWKKEDTGTIWVDATGAEV